jgi:hypothetical protein
MVAVALGTPEQFGFSVAIIDVTPDSVSISYAGLPANQPQTYQNFLAIWEASMIPWTVEPLKKEFITSNNQQGSFGIDGLTITRTSYIVGYGVGPSITTICASALLAMGGLAAAPTSISIALTSIGANSLTVSYRTLAGYLPQQYGNWIGLWRGYASPYNPAPLLARASVESMATEGDVVFNDVPLARDANYTLIYFVGAELTTAAAMLNFSTAPAAGTTG